KARRETSHPAHRVQVHTEKGKLSCGAFDLITGVAENRLVGRHVGAGDVPAEEAFVRMPGDSVDDLNEILGAESAATLVEVREERPHDGVQTRYAVGVVTNGEV